MRTNRPFRLKLSHFPNDTTFLHVGLAASDVVCDICKQRIATGATYYFIDTNGRMKPEYICVNCKFIFTPTSYQRPYWLTAPDEGACSNIRTDDDQGWREYIDNLFNEWDEIFSEDMTRQGK